MAFDFKKEYREIYLPEKKPDIILVPKMNYIMDLHSAATAITCKVLSAEIQVPMKAICFPASTGSLFGRSIVNVISKIIGKKEHIWKICT